MPALFVNVPPPGPAHGPVIAGEKPDLGGVTGAPLIFVNISYASIITLTHANNTETKAGKNYRRIVYTSRRNLVARTSSHGRRPSLFPFLAACAAGAA